MGMKAFVLLTLLLLASVGQAEIYKWVDEEGRTHFTNEKPEQADAEVVSPKAINTFTHQVVPESSFYQPPERQKTFSGKSVVMYATPTCRYCKKARQYFAAQGIAYTEYDIDSDPEARRRFQKLGGRGVPFIQVGNMFLQGFSAKRFERYYYGNTDFLQDK